MTWETLAIILILCIIFNKTVQSFVTYAEETVVINTSEDRVQYRERAQEVAQRWKDAGPISTLDLIDIMANKPMPKVKPATKRKVVKK